MEVVCIKRIGFGGVSGRNGWVGEVDVECWVGNGEILGGVLE